MKKILLMAAFLGAVTITNAQTALPVVPKFTALVVQHTVEDYTLFIKDLIKAYDDKDETKIETLKTQGNTWAPKIKMAIVRSSETGTEADALNTYLSELHTELNNVSESYYRTK